MKALVAVLIIVLSLGCMQDEEQFTTTTTSTPPQKLTSEKALDMIKRSKINEFMEENQCFDLEVTKSGVGTCIGCLNVTVAYKCTGYEGSNVTYYIQQTYDVGLEGIRITYPRVAKQSCFFDIDCLPEVPRYNKRYFCNLTTCAIGDFIDEASINCLSKGNRVLQIPYTNRRTENICFLKNRNTCDTWSYFYGRCTEDTGNLTLCTPNEEICPNNLNPVCANIETVSGETKKNIWRNFKNPCMACSFLNQEGRSIGYRIGECTSTTTTTLGNPYSFNAVANYCEQFGYSFKIRKYPNGDEYGVCITDKRVECDADDFYDGKCP